jgi:hypothetical protein
MRKDLLRVLMKIDAVRYAAASPTKEIKEFFEPV